jgi:hypothetical protein
MKFKGEIKLEGKTATGIEVPSHIVEGLGKSKKPAVRVTFKGHTYRTTIASMGGVFLIPVSGERREKAGVKAGDVVDIEVELDTDPRVITVPPDFQKALDSEPRAKEFFSFLSYSNKSRFVLSIEGAKTIETRQRRVEKSIAMLLEGKS